MSKPESFRVNLDYGTLKNDRRGSITVILPAAVLEATQVYSATSSLSLGQQNASSRVRIASSKDGGVFYVGSALMCNRTGTIAGPTSVPYDIVGYIARTSPTIVTATVSVTNPYGEGMAMAFGDETFTFEISTFLSPFV